MVNLKQIITIFATQCFALKAIIRRMNNRALISISLNGLYDELLMSLTQGLIFEGIYMLCDVVRAFRANYESAG